MKRGFTLIELLVVIAIIAILAAILFPVFAQAKEMAKKTTELSNFKQTGTSVQMYMGDFDDRFPMSNTGYPGNNCWGCSPPDTVPGQQLYPYEKNTAIHKGVKDQWDEVRRVTDQCQYMGCTNYANATPEERMYGIMVRSNSGMNYVFLSPWRYGPPTNYSATSASISASEVNSASETILFADAIWDRTSSGQPTGGGNWVIETPCWKDTNNNFLRPLSQYASGTGDGSLWSYPNGWDINSWLVYGGTWPFWNQTDLSNISPGLKDGQEIVIMCDTSAKSRPVIRLTDGCTAYGAGQYKGQVTDTSKFIWDLD